MDVDSAVLAIVWGDPPRVLVVRKACSSISPWACDVALPGGSIEAGEDPISTALREAWEESYVHPGLIEVIGLIGVESTRVGPRRTAIILARPRGPIDPRPSSSEIDFVGWIKLNYVLENGKEILHPRRGVVKGVELQGGLILWGLTFRALRRVAEKLGERIRDSSGML